MEESTGKNAHLISAMDGLLVQGHGFFFKVFFGVFVHG